MHTHYDNLKVARNAPLAVIKAAYRALSQQYHPDKSTHPDADRIMKDLNAAFAVLGNEVARAEYDRKLAAEEASMRHHSSAKSQQPPRPAPQQEQEAEARHAREEAARKRREETATRMQEDAERERRREEAAARMREESERERREAAAAGMRAAPAYEPRYNPKPKEESQGISGSVSACLIGISLLIAICFMPSSKRNAYDPVGASGSQPVTIPPTLLAQATEVANAPSQGEDRLGVAGANTVNSPVAYDSAENTRPFQITGSVISASEPEHRLDVAGKALEEQLACRRPPNPGDIIRGMLKAGLLKYVDGYDGIPVFEPSGPLTVFGRRVTYLAGWQFEANGKVADPFSRGPGTSPPLFLAVSFRESPEAIPYKAYAPRGADGMLINRFFSSIDQGILATSVTGRTGSTIHCYGD
ncbi:J domain-containing protein [Cupriavidus oxalaticus]|uniref:J domain-containing protein n=1 Tax=Cupriavidus oxalaticus TaxID=96344 RepID=A0A4P7LIU1_9BURK|nr:J domain-containing protein [Cupriavidus oxalaticus]QBY56070.1 J domain-containing protein [Cupriavidus oxalaticus]